MAINAPPPTPEIFCVSQPIAPVRVEVHAGETPEVVIDLHRK